MGIKMSPKNSPEVIDGYVKYEEAEVDGLEAILKTTSRRGGGLCGIQFNSSLPRRGLLNYCLFFTIRLFIETALIIS